MRFILIFCTLMITKAMGYTFIGDDYGAVVTVGCVAFVVDVMEFIFS